MKWIHEQKNFCILNYTHEINDSQKIYNDFFQWIKNEIDNDIEDIKKKKLLYLNEGYCNLSKNIVNKMNDSSLRIKLSVLNSTNSEKFERYTKNKIVEQKFIKNKEDLDYNIYTDLLSWYTVTPECVSKVIINLFNKQINNKTSNRIYKEKLSEKNVTFDNKNKCEIRFR